jgi:hypothetical protein
MSKKTETNEAKAEERSAVVAVTKPAEPFDFDTFEIKTLEDFKTWNLYAHKAFREAKKHNPKCDPPVPVRVPDESFHQKMRVKFQRFDQPENVLKTCLRTSEINWKGQLKPGAIYDLPLPVIRYLNKLSVPIFAEVDVDNGGEVKKETRQIGERSRFSCQLLDLI